MTALNKQAYRADGGDIGIGRLKEIADNAYGDEEKRWLAQRVLALLDENLQLQRDKDSLEAVSIAMRDDMREAREKQEAAEKLAEVESRGADEVAACGIYWLKKFEAAERRIAELEARTVTLPDERFRYGESDYDDGFVNGWNAHGIETKSALRAAGIGVKGE